MGRPGRYQGKQFRRFAPHETEETLMKKITLDGEGEGKEHEPGGEQR